MPETTEVKSYYALKMPCGEYLRDVFESYEDDESNYTTCKSVLSAVAMKLTDKHWSSVFCHGSALDAPKYFVYHVPQGHKKGKYYETVEEFCRATGAQIKYVTINTKTIEEESDVYGKFIKASEVHISNITLDVLEQLKLRKWGRSKNDQDS